MASLKISALVIVPARKSILVKSAQEIDIVCINKAENITSTLKYEALWPIFISRNEILPFYVTIEANFAFWQHYLMKLKSFHTVLLTAVLFTLLLPLSAVAQEDKVTFDPEIPTKESIKQDQESPSGTENQELRATKNSTSMTTQEPAIGRDSELKNAKPVIKTVEKPQKEYEKIQKEEDDPLSFNFLYYIIEKFKVSDIVE